MLWYFPQISLQGKLYAEQNKNGLAFRFLVQMMKANPDLEVRVEGHTDNAGNPKSNKTLPEERAEVVAAAITAQGIDVKRLTPAGYGRDRPVADNETEEGRAKNRRVELVKK